MLVINGTEYLESLKGSPGTWIFELYANSIINSFKCDNNYLLHDILSNTFYNFTDISILAKVENDYVEYHLFVIYNDKFRFIYPINNKIEMAFEYTPSYITPLNLNHIKNGNVVTINHTTSKELLFTVAIDTFTELFYKN